MMKDKKMWIIISWLYVLTLITYRMPHHNISFIQRVIPPISSGNTRIDFSGILVILFFLFIMKELFKLEYFKDRSRIFIVLCVLIVVLPAMRYTVNLARQGYHRAFDNDLSALDFEEVSLLRTNPNGQFMIRVSVDIKDYGIGDRVYRLRLKRPDVWREFIEDEYLEIDMTYHTTGGNQYHVSGDIMLAISEEDFENFMNVNWYHETLRYRLYNDTEHVDIYWTGR